MAVCGWLTYKNLCLEGGTPRPIHQLLSKLKKDGNDVEGAFAEYDGIRFLLQTFHNELDILRRVFDGLDNVGLGINGPRK